VNSNVVSIVAFCLSLYAVFHGNQPLPVMQATAAASTDLPTTPAATESTELSPLEAAPSVDRQPEAVATFDYGDSPGDISVVGLPSAFEDVPPPVVTPVTQRSSTPPVVTDDVASQKVTPANDTVPTAFNDVPADTAKDLAVAVVDPARAIPNVIQAVAPQGEAADAWLDNLYPVKCGDWSGTAVAIAPDTLLTVHHIVGQSTATIDDHGTARQVVVTYPQGADDFVRDGAVLKLKDGKLPAIKVRKPQYFEAVTVYGLTTKTKYRGIVTGQRTVSLLPDAAGIKNGDSGGAVIADDGTLVGLISGNENDPYGLDKTDTRIVSILRMDYMLPYVPYESRHASAMQAAAPKSEPSAFDPPPLVNNNQQTCAPNTTCRQQPQTTSQPATTWYYTSQPRSRGWFRR